MSELLKLYKEYESLGEQCPTEECRDFFYSIESLIEEIVFAKADDIYDLLSALKKENNMIYAPPWFRTLAYRLIIFQKPKEREILKEAIYDLSLFDWNFEEYNDNYKKLSEE